MILYLKEACRKQIKQPLAPLGELGEKLTMLAHTFRKPTLHRYPQVLKGVGIHARTFEQSRVHPSYGIASEIWQIRHLLC